MRGGLMLGLTVGNPRLTRGKPDFGPVEGQSQGANKVAGPRNAGPTPLRRLGTCGQAWGVLIPRLTAP
jgi:hypothetical protein